MQELEEENARLVDEIEALRRDGGGSIAEELEDVSCSTNRDGDCY